MAVRYDIKYNKVTRRQTPNEVWSSPSTEKIFKVFRKKSKLLGLMWQGHSIFSSYAALSVFNSVQDSYRLINFLPSLKAIQCKSWDSIADILAQGPLHVILLTLGRKWYVQGTKLIFSSFNEDSTKCIKTIFMFLGRHILPTYISTCNELIQHVILSFDIEWCNPSWITDFV